MALPKVPTPKLPTQNNYLANVVARHIVMGKKYPMKLPKVPSVLNSLPAVLKHFGGSI